MTPERITELWSEAIKEAAAKGETDHIVFARLLLDIILPPYIVAPLNETVNDFHQHWEELSTGDKRGEVMAWPVTAQCSPATVRAILSDMLAELRAGNQDAALEVLDRQFLAAWQYELANPPLHPGETVKLIADLRGLVVGMWTILREQVDKYLSAQDHDLCHENRRELAEAFGLEDTYCKPNLTLAEFDDGCLEYQKQIYGESASDARQKEIEGLTNALCIIRRECGLPEMPDSKYGLRGNLNEIPNLLADARLEARALKTAVCEYLAIEMNLLARPPQEQITAYQAAKAKIIQLSGFTDNNK